jgi:hypothetical protein
MSILQQFTIMTDLNDLKFDFYGDEQAVVAVAGQPDGYSLDCVFPNQGAAKRYHIDESALLLNCEAVLESLGTLGQRALVRLDASYPGVGEAVEALSREQFSPQMYRAQYFNGEETVNFPLTAEKLANFSRIDGMQLLGILDTDQKLSGFACFFVKQWPDFAGDLKAVADSYSKNSDPKTYLYLVLVRPNAKGEGSFESMYDQVKQDSIAVGNVGTAIEIHQLNAQSVIAHRAVGFCWMGTAAIHEREDVTETVFPLRYRQYYLAYATGSDRNIDRFVVSS